MTLVATAHGADDGPRSRDFLMELKIGNEVLTLLDIRPEITVALFDLHLEELIVAESIAKKNPKHEQHFVDKGVALMSLISNHYDTLTYWSAETPYVSEGELNQLMGMENESQRMGILCRVEAVRREIEARRVSKEQAKIREFRRLLSNPTPVTSVPKKKKDPQVWRRPRK